MPDPTIALDDAAEFDAHDRRVGLEHRHQLETSIEGLNVETVPLVNLAATHVLSGSFRPWRFGRASKGDLYFLAPGSWVFVSADDRPQQPPVRMWQVSDRLGDVRNPGGEPVQWEEVLLALSVDSPS